MLRDVLDVRTDATFRTVLRESMSPNAKLLEVLVSVACRDHDVGELGRAVLSAAHARCAYYRNLACEIRSAVPGAMTLKGDEIAQHYPADVVRGSVDLDLYLSRQEDVWASARLLRDGLDSADVAVSMTQSDDHLGLFVGLSWPAPGSIFDPPYRVEFCTAPLLGNLSTVPARVGLPDDPTLAQLVLLAEEQFQRKIISRDILDAAFLTAAAELLHADASIWSVEIGKWRVAPELQSLLNSLARFDVPELAFAKTLSELLVDYVETEEKCRDSVGANTKIKFGLPLNETHTTRAELVELELGDILLSPLGTFLMVDDLSVSEDRYEAALRAVTTL